MKNFLLVVLLELAAPALAQVSVQEYAIPRGHYAHDVWADAAPGGPVWFSAQRGGELGILDPASGKVEFVPLGPGSAPHGVIGGGQGARRVWSDSKGSLLMAKCNSGNLSRYEPGTGKW